MNSKFNKTLTMLLTICLVGFYSCNKSDSSILGSDDNETLHTSFYTPEWSAVIPCHSLVFDYTAFNTYTATSVSTNLTFQLTLPQDSSVLNQSTNKKKYPVYGYSSVSPLPPFTYLQKVPFTKGSTQKLLPIYNPLITDSSYHKIAAITYSYSDTTGAYFKLKGEYKMMMRKYPLSTDPDSVRFVYGDYLILVKTFKK